MSDELEGLPSQVQSSKLQVQSFKALTLNFELATLSFELVTHPLSIQRSSSPMQLFATMFNLNKRTRRAFWPAALSSLCGLPLG
jgi:hypothetical protein